MTSSTPEPATSVMPTASSSDHAETGPRPALEPGAGLRLVCLPLAMLLILVNARYYGDQFWVAAAGVAAGILAIVGIRQERRHRVDPGPRAVLNASMLMAAGVVFAPLLALLVYPVHPFYSVMVLWFTLPISLLLGLAGSIWTILSLRGPDGEYRRSPLGAISALLTSLVYWTPLVLALVTALRGDGFLAGQIAFVLAGAGLVTGAAAVVRGRGRGTVPAAIPQRPAVPARPEYPPRTASEPYPALAHGAEGRLVGMPLALLLLLVAWTWTSAAVWVTAAGLLLSILVIVGTVRERRNRVDPRAGAVVNSARMMALGIALLQLVFLLVSVSERFNPLLLIPISVLLAMAGSIGTVISFMGPRGEYRRTRLGAISGLTTSLVSWIPLISLYIAVGGRDVNLLWWIGGLLAAIGLVTGIVAVLQARTQRPLPEGSPTAAYGQDKNP